jgi:hypothetical protein
MMTQSSSWADLRVFPRIPGNTQHFWYTFNYICVYSCICICIIPYSVIFSQELSPKHENKPLSAWLPTSSLPRLAQPAQLSLIPVLFPSSAVRTHCTESRSHRHTVFLLPCSRRPDARTQATLGGWPAAPRRPAANWQAASGRGLSALGRLQAAGQRTTQCGAGAGVLRAAGRQCAVRACVCRQPSSRVDQRADEQSAGSRAECRRPALKYQEQTSDEHVWDSEVSILISCILHFLFLELNWTLD